MSNSAMPAPLPGAWHSPAPWEQLSGSPFVSVETTWVLGGSGGKVAIVNRDVAGPVVAGRLELRGGAEHEMAAIGREASLDEAVIAGWR
jgi:hypothetical protein